jgi:hypothetical protein
MHNVNSIAHVVFFFKKKARHRAAFFGSQVRDGGSNPRRPQPAHATYHQATGLSASACCLMCHHVKLLV